MSPSLTVATPQMAVAPGFGAIFNGLAAAAVLLLICLLVAQLLLRALGGVAGRRADMLDRAIWPLVLVMAVSTALRLAQLLRVG